MSRRFVVPAILLVCSSLSGCLSPGSSLSQRAPTSHVYFVRGGVGYFPGTESLRAALEREGAELRMVRNLDSSEVAEEILARKRAGEINGPVVLGGYSAGGANASLIAEELRAEGVAVDSLILVETTRPNWPVPSNVRRCLNMYRPGGLFGGPVAGEIRATEVVNYDTSEVRDFRYASHWNITWTDGFPSLMAEEVQTVLSRSETTRERRRIRPVVRLLPPRPLQR